MPEAVKETTTEKPVLKEEVVEKVPCKEVSRVEEASSGTLPVDEKKSSKDVGEGAVAPDLGQVETPEEGKNSGEEKDENASDKTASSVAEGNGIVPKEENSKSDDSCRKPVAESKDKEGATEPESMETEKTTPDVSTESKAANEVAENKASDEANKPSSESEAAASGPAGSMELDEAPSEKPEKEESTPDSKPAAASLPQESMETDGDLAVNSVNDSKNDTNKEEASTPAVSKESAQNSEVDKPVKVETTRKDDEMEVSESTEENKAETEKVSQEPVSANESSVQQKSESESINESSMEVEEAASNTTGAVDTPKVSEENVKGDVNESKSNLNDNVVKKEGETVNEIKNSGTVEEKSDSKLESSKKEENPKSTETENNAKNEAENKICPDNKPSSESNASEKVLSTSEAPKEVENASEPAAKAESMELEKEVHEEKPAEEKGKAEGDSEMKENNSSEVTEPVEKNNVSKTSESNSNPDAKTVEAKNEAVSVDEKKSNADDSEQKSTQVEEDKKTTEIKENKGESSTELKSTPEEKVNKDAKSTESKSDPTVNKPEMDVGVSSEVESTKAEESDSKSNDTQAATTDADSKAAVETKANGKGTTEQSEGVSSCQTEAEAGGSRTLDPKLVEEVQVLIRDAKAQMAASDYFTAADVLGKACEIAGKLYGDLAKENAELYYLYGCAMLECAKNENPVLGEAVKDGEDDAEDTENADEGEGTDVNEEEKMEVENNEGDSMAVEKDDEASNEKAEENGIEAETNGEGETTKEGEDEEEDSSLKVAWEMFELAKIIFGQVGNDLRLSDTYIKLGEVGMESGHATAIEDMKSALELRKKCANDNERLLAETHFNIGLAYATFQSFDEAINEFKTSKSILQGRIDKLKQKNEQAMEEIKELSDLLPDLDEKITDMDDSKKAKEKSEGEPTNGGASIDAAGCSKPISNISHLVKRKRKLEEVTSDLLPSSKQQCTEAVTDPQPPTKKDSSN